MPVFIVDRLIINSHERVIPGWDIRKIRRLFFEIETRPNFNQFFGKRASISSKAASLTLKLPVISRLALYFARKKSRNSESFVLRLTCIQ